MKYHIKDNGTLEGTPAEVALVIRALSGNLRPTEDHAPVRKTKKHKRHQFRKTCGRCGGVFLGNVGLAIHQAKCKTAGVAGSPTQSVLRSAGVV